MKIPALVWLIGFAMKDTMFFLFYEELRGITDDEIIKKAFAENYIIITCDKDFGEEVYKQSQKHKGIILLRLKDDRSVIKIKTLKMLFKKYLNELENNFVVVTETTVRLSRK